MKLFSTRQIAELDKYTIENEPIADIDLMERASLQISNWIVQRFSTENEMVFFAGPGNNGGDALAVARQLAELDYCCAVYLMDFGKGLKGSSAVNWERLEKQNKVNLLKVDEISAFPELGETDILIDGLFGSGLSRPLEGIAAGLVQALNQCLNTIIAIDIPSGLMGEDNSGNNGDNIVRADFTLTLQFPKLSFLFAENEKYVGEWEVLPIGLHTEGIKSAATDYCYVDKEEVLGKIPFRSRFVHKGTFGHALLISGSVGKMGAAILASKACLRAGVGLLTSHVPRMGYGIIQTAVPEAMTSIDQHDSMCTEYPDLKPYTAIGIGPGLDQKPNSCKALCALLENAAVPLVIDADALNILAAHKEWLERLPENSVLTPHPGEFKRLVGETLNSYARLQVQIRFSKKYRVVLVVKGAFTTITTPGGMVYFNSTGNPGMATAGSGDVLTGIILGLLAQGLPSVDAAMVGVYLHGLAGDIAAEKRSQNALIAGDIIETLGEAFLQL